MDVFVPKTDFHESVELTETEDDGLVHFSESILKEIPFLQRREGQPRRQASLKQRAFIYQRDSGKCYYCKAEVTIERFHADHKVPYSKGGKTVTSNLVCSCRRCNLAKGTQECNVFLELLAKNGLSWRDDIAAKQARYFADQEKLARGDA